jgi:ABC-2 type transport system ATP-binding protein
VAAPPPMSISYLPAVVASSPAVLSALDAAGISVASVTVSRPSLDDVYLKYTGRAYTAQIQEVSL